MGETKHGEAMQLELGFRFHPTDDEVMTYLTRKREDPDFSCLAMDEFDIYSCEPQDLPAKAKFSRSGDTHWWFLHRRDSAKRTTPSGYWKSSGRDRQICSDKVRLGSMKTLVYYLGRNPKGTKTDWVLHEYRSSLPASSKDEWVVCCVFRKRVDDQTAPVGNVDELETSTAERGGVQTAPVGARRLVAGRGLLSKRAASERDDVQTAPFGGAHAMEPTMPDIAPLPASRALLSKRGDLHTAPLGGADTLDATQPSTVPSPPPPPLVAGRALLSRRAALETGEAAATKMLIDLPLQLEAEEGTAIYAPKGQLVQQQLPLVADEGAGVFELEQQQLPLVADEDQEELLLLEDESIDILGLPVPEMDSIVLDYLMSKESLDKLQSPEEFLKWLEADVGAPIHAKDDELNMDS